MNCEILGIPDGFIIMQQLYSALLFYYATIRAGDISTSTIQGYAITEAVAANLTPLQKQEVLTVIKGESGFDPTKINPNDKGCESAGLVQIRLCDHDVTEAQALDPIYAVNFLIQNIDKCKTWWLATCNLTDSS